MSEIILKEGSTPSTPPSGQMSLYAKEGGLPFIKNDEGAEKPINIGYENQYSLFSKISKDAAMICHFDGQEPYNTDFTGNPTGHMGQVAEVEGGVIYRPGKFGKAVQVAPAGTNLCPNPSFEVDYSSWNSNISGTVNTSIITTDSKFGNACMKLEYAGGSGGRYFNVNLTAGQTYTYSVWVKQTIGVSVSLLVYKSGTVASVSHTGTGEWTRISVTYTAAETAAYSFHVWKGTTVCETLVDGVLVEQSEFLRPYFDGSMNGCTWSGTEHLSTSTRTKAVLAYDIGKIPEGSISFYVKSDDWDGGGGYEADMTNIMTYGSPGTDGFFMRNAVGQIGCAISGGGSLSSGFVVSPDTWYFITVTWDNTGVKFYIDGVLVDSVASVMVMPTDTELRVGGRTPTVYDVVNGYIDDLAIFSRVLTADEVRAIYESDAPIPHFNSILNGIVHLTGIDDVQTPSNDNTILYADPTGQPYVKNDVGVESPIALGGVWQDWTPTPTASNAGTNLTNFVSSSFKYSIVGKICFFQLRFAVDIEDAATTNVDVPFPVTPTAAGQAYAVYSGWSNVTPDVTCRSGGSTGIRFGKADGTDWAIAANNIFRGNGFYEIA